MSVNPGKYISAEEQKRRDDALINDSTAKKTKKKKKKKGQITVSSILHNADKDEPETDSDEEDQSEKLNPLLTFAKGKIAAEKRKEALEVGVFVAANEAEEQTISATQQLKIDARLKKKEDAILKERKSSRAERRRRNRSKTTTQQIVTEEIKRMSCLRSIGCNGFLFLFSILFISIAEFVASYIYANPTANATPFAQIGTPYIWVFLLFSILFFLRFIYFSIFWNKDTKNRMKRKYLNSNNILNRRNPIMRVVNKIYFEKLGINGRYYLWKLYLFELIENCVQFANLLNVYTCTLPFEFVLLFTVVLFIESIWRSKFMYLKLYSSKSAHIIEVQDRNRQIKIDICVDLFFLLVPPCILWFGYEMPIAVEEMIGITIMPSFSLLVKLPGVFKQMILENFHKVVLNREEEESKKINRRRKSIYRSLDYEKIQVNQNKYFPRRIKLTIFIFSVSYSLTLIVIMIAQISSLSFQKSCESTLDNKYVWENGCKIKIPLCKRTFNPKCNCAYLHIENEKNLTKLPANMVTEMDGLRKVFVSNCSLTKLPSNMENLVEMTSFEVSFNNLTEFHVDVKQWTKLVKLYLMYNNIKRYDEEAMWTHPNLVSLDLGNNVGINVPGKIRLPLLSYLQLSNNQISLDLIFGQEQFPALMSLYLNGNTLIKFPDQGLKSNLVKLGISRCRLRSLPSYLSDFSKLAYLDARDNNITTVDDDLKVLINKNAIESYFSGNEKLCKSDKSLDCEPLCHKYCSSRKYTNDGYCDVECNHEVCEYDGGDCI